MVAARCAHRSRRGRGAASAAHRHGSQWRLRYERRTTARSKIGTTPQATEPSAGERRCACIGASGLLGAGKGLRAAACPRLCSNSVRLTCSSRCMLAAASGSGGRLRCGVLRRAAACRAVLRRAAPCCAVRAPSTRSRCTHVSVHQHAARVVAVEVAVGRPCGCALPLAAREADPPPEAVGGVRGTGVHASASAAHR